MFFTKHGIINKNKYITIGKNKLKCLISMEVDLEIIGIIKMTHKVNYFWRPIKNI